jgi:hypothetical protein
MTLVMDMVDILVKIVDPTSDAFDFTDETIKCFNL